MKYVEGSKKVFLNTGYRFQHSMIRSVAMIKLAASTVNVSLGLLDSQVGKAIAEAAREIMDGKFDQSVIVDVFQTGSGTGINMNINELIANMASQTRGIKVHPNDHVNMGQSSNDVVPSSVRMAATDEVTTNLLPVLESFIDSLERLSQRTAKSYKAGRTHFRDALPVTLGQEMAAYSEAFKDDLENISASLKHVKELPIGGTAVGTGLNAPANFGKLIVDEINNIDNKSFFPAKNKFTRMKLLTDVIFLSSSLSGLALDTYRLCQDLRLMFSGPITGLGEIDIPTQEEVAGSSIMPGKTNPITVEASMLAAAQVLGLDHAIHIAGMFGEFELSMGIPLTGYDILEEIKLLSESLQKLSSVVLDNVEPDLQKLRSYAESSPSLITIISPKIGYDKASSIGKKLSRGKSIRESLGELGYTEKEIDELLDMEKLIRGGLADGNNHN